MDVVGIFYDSAQEVLPEVKGNFEWREKWFHNGKTIREESEWMDKGLLKSNEPEGIGMEVAKDVAFRWGEGVEIYKRYSPKEQYQYIDSPLLFVVGSEDGFKTAGKELVNNLKALGRIAEYSEHLGMGHMFFWGLQHDANGNIHEEFYRSLKRTADFMRKWVKRRELPAK